MDDEPLILDIKLIGDAQALDIFKKIAQAVKSIQAPMVSTVDKTQQMQRNLQNAVGPAQRLAKALTQLRAAQQNGAGGAQLFDAQHNAMQAQKSMARAQQQMNPAAKSFGAKFMDVLKSSRFGVGSGAGGSLMPIVGQTMELLGPMASSLLGAVGIAYTAVKLMADAAQDAAKSLSEFRASMFQSGGTAGETAQLKGIGTLTGSDGADMARALANHLSQGGQASGFGASAGIHDFGTFDRTDKATNLLKMADYIRAIKSDEEAIRVARVEGVEPLLKLRDVAENVYQDFKKAEQMAASVRTPQDIRNAADLNAEMARFGMEADTLGTRLKESLIPGIQDLYSIGANALHAINDEATKLGKWWQDMMGVPANHRDGQTDHADATRENTAALRENARALKDGTYGGGQRARNAVPAAWGGSNAHNWSGATARLGAFNL